MIVDSSTSTTQSKGKRQTKRDRYELKVLGGDGDGRLAARSSIAPVVDIVSQLDQSLSSSDNDSDDDQHQLECDICGPNCIADK